MTLDFANTITKECRSGEAERRNNRIVFAMFQKEGEMVSMKESAKPTKEFADGTPSKSLSQSTKDFSSTFEWD